MKSINNSFLYQCLRIRRIEEALANNYKYQNIRCPMHLSIGQESSAVAICSQLRITDKVFSGHRAHAHYIAKGGDLKRLFAELYGKATGCSGGWGGSMHLIDLDVGFMGSTAIVGGTIPLAVGCAWASKLQGNRDVTVVFFGDGAFEEGVMYESFNFASLHNLPIIFICENNKLAVTTGSDKRKSEHTNMFATAADLGVSAWSFFPGEELTQDGTVIIRRTIDSVRNLEGPRYIEFHTELQREHCGTAKIRELKNDPLKNYKTNENLIIYEIMDAFRFAEESPEPVLES